MSVNDVTVMACEWSGVIITFLAVLSRLVIRFRYHRLSISDAFVVSAWLVFLSTVSIDTVTYRIGYLAWTIGAEYPGDAHYILASKLIFVENTTYQLCMYFVKASMLCFYAEFVTRHLIFKTWCVLVSTAVLVFIGALWGPLFHIFWCWPVSRNWTMSETDYCSIIDVKWVMGMQFALHIGTDLLILLIPLLVLHEMRSLPMRQKIGAGLMFTLGLLSILCAVGTFHSFYIVAWNSSQDLRAYIYVTIEEVTSVTVACCPAFRLLWRRGSVARFNSSNHSGSGGWGSEAVSPGGFISSGSNDRKGSLRPGTGASRGLKYQRSDDSGMHLAPWREPDDNRI